jgi:biopolymer transport protein ExbD
MRRLIDSSPAMDRINVTPIIDVALVLVIILLMTAPMLSSPDVEVSLPQASTRGTEEYRNMTITMGLDGRIAIDERLVSYTQLEAELARRLADPTRKNAIVVVRADAGLPHIAIREVLESARAVGATRIAIATDQKTSPQ